MFNLISLKNGLENVEGFYFGGVNAGFKTNGDNDLGAGNGFSYIYFKQISSSSDKAF